MTKTDKPSGRVRVRVAPSPTGDPHVGTAYIALFNYVFAKKMQGDFILRIEDTDRSRSRASSEQMIYDSLRWLGLSWDEGPDVGGAKGPYRQSERKNIYAEYAQKLLDNGFAYRDFDSVERTAAARKQQQKQGGEKIMRADRDRPAAESERLAAEGKPHVVRLKMPVKGSTAFDDVICGRVEIENKQIDDQVLLKSDGFPTYHLANVVDDHLMEITHVIRAEDWISSTPKHVVLYEGFGWPQPTWVHMPLLRNNDKSKISKRKNPTSIAYYRRAGILPDALRNFLGLMSWSFGDDVEVFCLDEMIARFELKGLHSGGPIFDQQKLRWLNQTYMQRMSRESFVEHLRQEVFSTEYLSSLHPLVQDRLDRFESFTDKFSFFFNGALAYDGLPIPPKGREKSEIRKMLKELVERLDETYDWTAENIKAVMDEHRNELGFKPKDYFMTLRLLVTGRKDSPDLVESLVVLGREMVRFRLRDALKSPILAP